MKRPRIDKDLLAIALWLAVRVLRPRKLKTVAVYRNRLNKRGYCRKALMVFDVSCRYETLTRMVK